MNDLYINPANLTDDEMENAPVCEGCEADAPLVRIGTAEGDDELLCDECAQGTINDWPGNVHDRREDAEALLREVSLAVMNAAHKTGDPDPDARMGALVAILARIAKR